MIWADQCPIDDLGGVSYMVFIPRTYDEQTGFCLTDRGVEGNTLDHGKGDDGELWGGWQPGGIP